MIYFHKILPVFLLPIGLTITCIVAGLISRKRWICWAGVIIIWGSSTLWVGDRVMSAVEGQPLQPALYSMPTADTIVVLAGGLLNPTGNGIGQWTDTLVNRFEAGVEIYLAGKASLLLFTNGWLPWQDCSEPIESSLMALAEKRGVPGSSLLTTVKVKNTAEEASAVADELLGGKSGQQTRTIILVTSAFHMRRAKLLFEETGFTVIPFPTDFRVCRNQPLTILDFIPSADGLKKTETALREVYGYLYYQVLGWWQKIRST